MVGSVEILLNKIEELTVLKSFKLFGIKIHDDAYTFPLPNRVIKLEECSGDLIS